MGRLARVVLDRREHALAHLEDVVAVLLVGGDEYRAFALVAAGVAVCRGVPAHLGHVADAHDAAVHRGDDGVAHLVERGVAARGLEAEAARIRGRRSRQGCWRSRSAPRAITCAGARFSSAMRLQVHRHAQFARRIGPGLRGAHAVDRLERVLELARVILQLAVRRVFGHQRDLDGVHQAGRKTPDDDLRLRRKLRPQRIDLARDFVEFLVGVDEGLEFDGGERHAVAHRGLDLHHVVERRDAVLDGLGRSAAPGPWDRRPGR